MSCAVPGCTNNRRFKPKGVSFHRFPQDELLDEWLNALCKDPIKSWVWSKNKVVCSLHFVPEDFILVGDRRLLKITAVPSILPTKPRKIKYFLEEQINSAAKPTTSRDIFGESSAAQIVIKSPALLNAVSLPSALVSDSKQVKYFVEEHDSKGDVVVPSTSVGGASESSVVHFVIKSETSVDENKPKPSETELHKGGVEWESMKHPKGPNLCYSGYNSIAAATTVASSTSNFNNCSPSVNPNHTVYVNTSVANWNIKKSAEETDPLAPEASTTNVSLVKPKKVRRKPRTVDVAVATSPTRNQLKANLNVKRLTGLSLPFFTELLSLFDEKDHPRYRKLNPYERLLLFLIKMKWGIPFVSLASFFQVNPFSASRFFADVLDTLYDISQQWLVFCAQSTKKSDGSCGRFKVIIDCFEVLTECPDSSKETDLYSTNTRRPSYKFLIGVAPSGSVSFVSKAQGGSASKDAAFKGTCSSWSSCVQAGDLVAIGKGCPELESTLQELGAVAVPFFAEERGCVDLEELVACRHRFERTVQKLKRFEILKLVTPEFSNKIDKIVHMCCVLVNHKLLKPSCRKK